MASGLKVDIQWSPCFSNRFICFGTDLSLYQVEEISDGIISPLNHQLSDTHCAQVLFTNPNPQYLKCVAWYPKPEYEYLLAIGLANGKIVLNNLGSSQEPTHLIGKELVPRYSRQCNCLTWNPVECNLLMSGLEKSKADHSIFIWDVQKCPLKQEGERRMIAGSNANDSNFMQTKPFVETGNAESVHSLHWLLHQPKGFVAGISNKYLKIYDIRDPSKAQQTTPTKAVFGITVDPFFENRLASFAEGLIVIWDTRNFEKPIATLQEPRATTKIAWCPTRSNLLASSAKDSHILKLYDIQNTSSVDEVELNASERYLQPCGQQQIASFSWHPTQDKRLILVSSQYTFIDFTVFERLTVSWSPSSRLVWNVGMKQLRDVHEEQYYHNLQDISIKMRHRALRDYGIKVSSSQNSSSLQNSPFITSDFRINMLWSWIEMLRNMHDEGVFNSWTRNFKYQGIREIICSGKLSSGNGTNTKSDVVNQPWPNLSSQAPIVTKIYCSKDRDCSLQLCGWGCDRDGHHLTKLLDSLEKDHAYERAAAISIFNLQIQRAIDSLQKGALYEQNNSNYNNSNRVAEPGNVNLNIVAMALSGYTTEKTALWRRMCHMLRNQLRHPYLRAMFSFLTSDEESYGEVLNERGLAMQDRIAFACWFLNDAKLSDYLNKSTVKMITRGNLEGILLTGLQPDGVDLMQQYVDMTGDIQTPCLLIMHASSLQCMEDPRVLQWVESYRALLDQWQLWHYRAKFDVQWNKTRKSSSHPAQHIYISCNYCGKSVSSSMGTQSTMVMPKSPHPSLFANKTKMTSCPGCRKPLPRCAVCLINMGTASGTGIVKQDGKMSEACELRLTKFASWFTWCQSCRHGGHSGHIIEWFKDHTECPVTGCSCKCMSLDGLM